MLITYFEIGRMIVEDEQQGKQRAVYAKEVLIGLSNQLTKEFGKGYSIDNLERFRKFYQIYQFRISASGDAEILNWCSKTKIKIYKIHINGAVI